MDIQKLIKHFFGVFFLFSAISQLAAQVSVPFDTINWDIRSGDFQIAEYKGQKALFMKGGVAILNDVDFENGVVEFDMAFPEKRGFSGLRFRMTGAGNFEEFYLRPHQSGKADANQYCPVYDGVSSWQLYHGAAYSVPYEYNFNKWFHLKLVINGTQAEVYIDNMNIPILHIPYLDRTPVNGGLMVYSGLVPTHFANFAYTKMSNPKILNKPKPKPELDHLYVKKWSVSNSFADSLLNNTTSLSNTDLDELQWSLFNVDWLGTANLAKNSKFDRVSRNCVFARIVINSELDQVKELDFGFSDRLKIFCNGQIIYEGNDGYVTRDYRFLGTIGLFDTVYLPVKKGENEIWFAVSESFGGWGLKAKFRNMEAITLLGQTD